MKEETISQEPEDIKVDRKIMDFKEVILAYETYLMEEGKVESTIDSYVGDIRGFLEFLESKKSKL